MSSSSSDLRKSLESIQSLLSQTVTSPMTATSLTSRLYQNTSTDPPQQQPQQQLPSTNNNNNNDYMTLHSPSLLSSSLLFSPQTPATQATLPSDGVPGGGGGSRFQQQQRSDEERLHHHQRRLRNSNNSSIGDDGTGGRQHSERSSSICNFSNATPYQINAAAAASLAFGSGVAVIGSPLSAFSAVPNSSGGGGGGGGSGRRARSRGRRRGGDDDDDDDVSSSYDRRRP